MKKYFTKYLPEATWVKEGDEFDEEEVMILHQIWDSVLWINVTADDYAEYKGRASHRILVKILGPCKHFH